MDKMSQDGYRKGTAKRKFSAKDLPWLREMVKLVKTKILSEEKASQKYKVTRHQVRKFVKLYGDQLFEKDITVDEEKKSEVIKVVISVKSTIRSIEYPSSKKMKTLIPLDLQAQKNIFRSLATKIRFYLKNQLSAIWRHCDLNAKALIYRSALLHF